MATREKWTQGPWRVFVTPYVAQTQVRDDENEIVVAAVPRRDGTADANAHLIAAAPELYEALDAVLRAYIEPWAKADSAFQAAAQQAATLAVHAALRKARGEA